MERDALCVTCFGQMDDILHRWQIICKLMYSGNVRRMLVHVYKTISQV